MFEVGARVTRAPNWPYENQDGFPGNIGTIIKREGTWWRVEWDGVRITNVYRAKDLMLLNSEVESISYEDCEL